MLQTIKVLLTEDFKMETLITLRDDFIIPVFVYAIAYFSPIKEATSILLILLGLDMITGVWKAIRLNGISSVNSKGLRNTVPKAIHYFILIISLFMIEHGIMAIDCGITKLVILVCATIEATSICENLYIISGNKVFKTASSILGSKVKKILNKKK